MFLEMVRDLLSGSSMPLEVPFLELARELVGSSSSLLASIQAKLFMFLLEG